VGVGAKRDTGCLLTRPGKSILVKFLRVVMARRKEGKRIRAARAKVQAEKLYSVEDGCEVVA
jgi:DNA repair ATPase RecN